MAATVWEMNLDNKYLYIILRDTKGKISNLKLKFQILDHPLAKDWTELFIQNFLKSDHPIEKDYMLKGWIDSWNSKHDRNLDFLCTSMNKSIERINRYMHPQGYNYIDLNFSVEKLKSDQYQILMNEIHHHFELLIGQVWNPSKWFQLADSKTAVAIRLLNNLCHEIESTVRSIKESELIKKKNTIESFRANRELKHSSASIYGSLMGKDFQGNHFLNKVIKNLNIDHYKSFSKYKKWGDVHIYYSQLGKRHFEVFADGDKEINRNNISGYRYVTGEFIIEFGGSQINKPTQESKEFFKWLDNNNFDKTDPYLGLGFPVVAELVTTRNKLDLIKEIRIRDDIYEIGLENDNEERLYFKIYDFTWRDLDQIKNFD